jgi:anti-sigma regulatory factor (Ser/Thr protein kinase)
MMEELDLHILDLVQNAIGAGARRIEITCREDEEKDLMTLRVRDDGMGMSAETLQAIEQGFYSTKAPCAVGLGIPLLRQTAEHCDGGLTIESEPGKGTTITATFRADHVDLPPFGDLVSTYLSILTTSEDRRIRIDHRCGGKVLAIDTAEIAALLDGLSIQHPEVIGFLKRYLAQALGGANEAGGSA